MNSRQASAAQPVAEERVLRRIPLEVLVIATILAIAALLFFTPLTSVFILAGGLFSALSFIWLKKALFRFLSPRTDAGPCARASPFTSSVLP